MKSLLWAHKEPVLRTPTMRCAFTTGSHREIGEVYSRLEESGRDVRLSTCRRLLERTLGRQADLMRVKVFFRAVAVKLRLSGGQLLFKVDAFRTGRSSSP